MMVTARLTPDAAAPAGLRKGYAASPLGRLRVPEQGAVTTREMNAKQGGSKLTLGLRDSRGNAGSRHRDRDVGRRHRKSWNVVQGFRLLGDLFETRNTVRCRHRIWGIFLTMKEYV